MVLLLLGITDDDLRETAYEVLLACAGATGYVVMIFVVCGNTFFFFKTFPSGFFSICEILIHFFFNRGLIVPSKEKKKDKKSSLIRKLGRSKSGSVVSQSQNAPGLVSLLETMRVQLEVYGGLRFHLCIL